ncbi:hypothetical protein ACFO26_04895 [Lactococcus nasutitermitis]|uniref:Uncharacterized protein n=1 Tax=Lactococcus nasutitermitis TaxID=1652957 RepID=A0ABV9JDX1_9LACT|nr:hypothetical protein [Lactococcus nasutitermitis]
MDIHIHTINVRDYIGFLAAANWLDWDGSQKLKHLNSESMQLRELLKSKGIKYDDLKKVLTPNTQKREIGLFFDTSQIKESFYGEAIFNKILPLLDKVKTHAIFSGDIIVPEVGGKRDNEIYLKFIREINVLHLPFSQFVSQYFVVYLNNIDETELLEIINGLSETPSFTGFADLSHFCFVKELVALSVGQTALKFRNKIILPEAESTIEGENLSIYPFSKYGFEAVGIDEWYYGIFLQYKIETRFIDQEDLLLSLNFLNPNPTPLESFRVLVEPSKFEYITTNENHNLSIVRKVGIDKMILSDFEKVIYEKIKISYIYNLKVDQYIARFNTKFEFENLNHVGVSSLLASFEYNFNENILRLLTMF